MLTSMHTWALRTMIGVGVLYAVLLTLAWWADR